VSGEPELEAGWVDATVAAELPGLRLASLVAPAPGGRAPRALAQRLRDLSSRWNGARAVKMRSEPVPQAYRVLFRHLGLDPDTDRPPQEAAVLERLVAGGFRSTGRLDDALLLAVVETGVPVWALDDARLDGPVGVRAARDAERLGAGELAHDLPRGRLVLADAERPVGVLFGDLAPEVVPTRTTTTLRLVAVAAPGVPELHVEEALWLAYEGVEGAPDAR
jgi:DNA/RNA-binding domain of Phe-tRNA-synthetase-like protein